MWTVTVPVSSAGAWPQTRSIRWLREKTRRGFEARNQSRSNSRAVSVTGAPAFVTSRLAPSSDDVVELEPLGLRAVAAPERRSTVRTRAASSRGENGFVT